MKCLLDTSALLAHYRDEGGAERVQELLDDSGVAIFVASVTLTEFSRRILALGAEQSEVQGVLGDYRLLFRSVVSIDEKIAQSAVGISAAAAERIPLVDSLIAAAASSIGSKLLHRDPHFASIPEHLLEQEMLKGSAR